MFSKRKSGNGQPGQANHETKGDYIMPKKASVLRSGSASEPIWDSGWRAIPSGGAVNHSHNLGWRPTLVKVYIADDEDGAYPVPALDYANDETGILIRALTCFTINVKFGTDYLAYSKDANKWYDRSEYYRIVIFADDSDWSEQLGVPPCRP